MLEKILGNLKAKEEYDVRKNYNSKQCFSYLELAVDIYRGRDYFSYAVSKKAFFSISLSVRAEQQYLILLESKQIIFLLKK